MSSSSRYPPKTKQSHISIEKIAINRLSTDVLERYNFHFAIGCAKSALMLSFWNSISQIRYDKVTTAIGMIREKKGSV